MFVKIHYTENGIKGILIQENAAVFAVDYTKK